MDTTATNPNIVDFFMAIVIVTIICSGARKGIIAEVFKLLGIFCTIFVTLHYYERFADVLRIQFFEKEASTEFFAFSVLGILTFVTFVLISKGWILILKIKFHEKIDRYGGAVLSLARSYFACGLIFFVLLLANHEYVLLRARKSVSRDILRYVAVDFYRAAYSALIEEFFPNEKLNEEAFKLVVKKKDKKKI